MFDVNEYFDGKVKSIGGFKADQAGSELPATIGVMKQGDYEFGTAAKEYMTVVSGSLTAKLPGSSEWVTYATGETFEVPGDSKFQVKADVDSAYLCRYA